MSCIAPCRGGGTAGRAVAGGSGAVLLVNSPWRASSLCSVLLSTVLSLDLLLNERVMCWADQERPGLKLDSCLYWKALPGICNSPVKSSVLREELLQSNFYHHFKLRERNHNQD